MGFHDETLNNWTPWICSNWLTVVLLCDKDADRRYHTVYRVMQSIDKFVNPYPADGGCDEGPGYWGRAGASLYDCLELLLQASNGRIDIFDQPVIRNMGTYIYKVHISDDYYVNFADAGAINSPPSDLVYRFGKNIRDEKMQQFAAWLAVRQQLGETPRNASLGRELPGLYTLHEITRPDAKAPLLRDVWFPELQVAIARSQTTSEGLYVAVKGGHNAESHNHNDVGNFVIYAGGKPVLMDIGVETYTAKTFSSQRYEIWTMQSDFHNLPTVNGVQQSPGRNYAATKVSYRSTDKKMVFSLDIAPSYSEKAHLVSWQRTVTLERGKKVEIEDDYQLQKWVEPVRWRLMTCRPADTGTPGTIALTDAETGAKTVITYDKSLTVSVEELPVTDQRLTSAWGNRLYRITLTDNQQKIKGKSKLTILSK
jgi:hypothetical protein